MDEKIILGALPILSAEQIKELDLTTLKQSSISSWELMERAAKQLANQIKNLYPDPDLEFLIFCGKGNNGGDGLAIARILRNEFRNVTIIALYDKGNTDEYNVNMQAALKLPNISYQKWENFSKKGGNAVIIDCVLGFSCNRKPASPESKVIEWMNQSGMDIVAIDVPSGMPVDFIPDWTTVIATHTLNIGPLKLTSFLPETGVAYGTGHQIEIGHAKPTFSTNKFVLNKFSIQSIMKTRPEFGHKGCFGHAGLVVGSKGMMGAAVLAVKSCLRSGVGLVSSFVPESGYNIMQISSPEAICHIVDENDFHFVTEKYTAIGTGCGLGTEDNVKERLKTILKDYKGSLILDADALNIIAEDKMNIPENSVLTPHPKEFDRLFGPSNHTLDRINKQIRFSAELGITIILKGHHTTVSTPSGELYFNSTGNSGMAKGGSGDVLSGLLTGLVAQGYSPEIAACLAIYIHGLSGDITAEKYCKTTMTAIDLIDNLYEAFKKIQK